MAGQTVCGLKSLTLRKACRYTELTSPPLAVFSGGKMKRLIAFAFGTLFLSLLGLYLAAPRAAFAQDHVVPPSQIQKDLAGVSATRQKNQAQLEGFVSSPEAQHALKSAHIDSGQVKNAIPQLDDEEMARLAARSEKAQKDFAAGRLSDRDLIIILVAIAALILIIVAVR